MYQAGGDGSLPSPVRFCTAGDGSVPSPVVLYREGTALYCPPVFDRIGGGRLSNFTCWFCIPGRIKYGVWGRYFCQHDFLLLSDTHRKRDHQAGPPELVQLASGLLRRFVWKQFRTKSSNTCFASIYVPQNSQHTSFARLFAYLKTKQV